MLGWLGEGMCDGVLMLSLLFGCWVGCVGVEMLSWYGCM